MATIRGPSKTFTRRNPEREAFFDLARPCRSRSGEEEEWTHHFVFDLIEGDEDDPEDERPVRRTRISLTLEEAERLVIQWWTTLDEREESE